jgi:sigma-E factor negative regulatory protein RseC
MSVSGAGNEATVGRVVDILPGGAAVVRVERASACGNCGSLCFSMSEEPTVMRLTARNDAGARVGDEVRLAVGEGVIVPAALWLYAVPTLLLLMGAGVGQGFGGDATAAAGAAAGLLVGLGLARWGGNRLSQKSACRPRIDAVMPPSRIPPSEPA